MKAILTAMLLAAPVLAGCAGGNQGTDRASAASASMAEFREQVNGAIKQVDKTIAAMNAMNIAKGDLKPSYENYVNELANAESYATMIRTNADEMKAKGREFFKKWEEEISKLKDPELQEKAKARVNERSKEYANIELVMETAKSRWANLSTEFKDVKQYLANDLTPKGLDSLSGKFTKINVDAPELKKALSEISAAVERVETDLSAKKAAAPTK